MDKKRKRIFYLGLAAVLILFVFQIVNTSYTYAEEKEVCTCKSGPKQGKECTKNGSECTESSCECVKVIYPEDIDLQVPIGSLKEVAQLKDYINALYLWFLGFASVVAIVMIAWGGFKWLTAAGNQNRISDAKNNIINALIGLVLAYTSYLLLYTINPSLVEFKDLSMPVIEGKRMSGSFCSSLPPDQQAKYKNKDGKVYDGKCGVYYLDGDENSLSCFGEKCDGNQICDTVSIFGQANCVDADKYCGKDTRPEDCQLYDQGLQEWSQAADSETYKKMSCRKFTAWIGFDHCTLANISTCKSDEVRIKCSEGGNESECFEDNKPEDCYSGDPEKMCQDDQRANENADGICCVKKKKAKCLEVSNNDCRQKGKYKVDDSYCSGCQSNQTCCADTYCKTNSWIGY